MLSAYPKAAENFPMKTQEELLKVDRTAFVVTSLHESDEKEYWLSKTPEERLQALELMRQIIYGYDPATARLQRVLEVAQRQTG
jgi:hypothetical protein